MKNPQGILGASQRVKGIPRRGRFRGLGRAGANEREMPDT
jgi:hypothetical protein